MEIVYKRTYTSLRIHAFRNHGFLSARSLQTLNLPTTPEVLANVLAELEVDGLLKILEQQDGDIVYDLLPFLEKAVSESLLDMPTRLQLAKIYLQRQMWTHAIAELRFTQTHPGFKKESLYLLAQCFEHKGAFGKARENYERLLALDYYYLDALERYSTLTTREQQQTRIGTAVTRATTTQAPLSTLLQERYEVVRELGRGGAGIVYHAIDLKLKRDVALKVLYQQPAHDQQQVPNFLREAQLAAQLKHPHLIEIYDVNLASQCIAMEFVDGGTLRDLLKQHHRLAAPQARAMIIQLCEGLHVAHQAGILHRDIKPENIFITKHHKIKLGDFGIAYPAALEQEAFTHISVQIGTLPYMSPEQVRGEPLGVASDLYAVGIVLYEMFTGAPPFMRGDIAYHHIHSVPPPPGISEPMDAIILRCLAKDPSHRFPSARELRRVLQAQERDEKTRMGKYRDLLKVALLDQELSPAELLVLKMKRRTLHLPDEEARRVEQELGLNIPETDFR